jgi:uncharacterized membrane protein
LVREQKRDELNGQLANQAADLEEHLVISFFYETSFWRALHCFFQRIKTASQRNIVARPHEVVSLK